MKKTAIIGAAALCVMGAAAVYAARGGTDAERGAPPPAPEGVAMAAATAPTAAPEPSKAVAPAAMTAEELLMVDAGATTASGGFTGDAPIGAADAPVTVIEYASLTCGHCATFHTQTYDAFKQKYVETGEVRFIMRDFPLDNFAIAAAIIARCGGESKYLGYVDLFMEQQHVWTRAENSIGELKKLARLGGLSSERIDACLNDAALGQSILDRARAAQEEFGISSTPSFLINGELVSGALTIDQMSEKVDAALGR